MTSKIKIFFGCGLAILASTLLSTTALALGGGGGGGSCSVRTESTFSATFFIPSGGSGSYAILGWGNGTASSVSQYDGLLEAAAEECVLVAAANTSSSGNGRAVRDAVNSAKSRYSSIVNSTVCTSGHSQGGGGSFNAARYLDADCVIAVQPDTVYTARIDGPVSSSTDVVCIFSTGDFLAPAFPSNGANCRRNSPGTYIQETTSGSHTSPYSGTGGAPGSVMREYINRWMN